MKDKEIRITNDCPKCKEEGVSTGEFEYFDNEYLLDRFKCTECGCIYSVTFKVHEVEIIE